MVSVTRITNKTGFSKIRSLYKDTAFSIFSHAVLY
jgi:hypothetical protein